MRDSREIKGSKMAQSRTAPLRLHDEAVEVVLVAMTGWVAVTLCMVNNSQASKADSLL
jgi:hypothetical protein